MLHSLIQHEGSWKIKSLQILPKGQSDMLLFNAIITTFVVCKFHFVQTGDQVPWYRFVQEGNTHEHVSGMIAQNSHLKH